MYSKFRAKKRHKSLIHRAVAFMLSLGMILNIIMQLDLTVPVIVAKADNEEGTLYFTSVQTAIPGSPQVAITNYDYTITAKGETYDKTSATPITITASPDTSIDLSLLMHYVFNDESTVTSIKNNGGYIYYQLPANLSFDQNYFGSNSKVKDTQYANAKWGGADVPSGYYSIWNGDNGDGTKSNPLLVIHFTPDYVNYFSANKYLEGNIEFEGKVNRDETIEGDQTLSFANGPTIKVDFAKDKVTAQKSNAESKKDDAGNPYLEWKVTVKNPGGRTNLTNYALSDKLNGSAFALNAENCTVEPSGDGSFENGTYVFSGKGEGQYQETYTFTYKQSNPTPALQYTNEVTLTGGDEDVTSEATGKIEDKLEVSKSGKADYQVTGDRDDTINWEITVENKSGNSLAANQAYLVDPAFGNYKPGTLSVIDANGDPMAEGTDYQIISGKVFYNDNNNLTDVTNASTSIDPDIGVPQIYVDENGNYIKINTMAANANVGVRDGVLYNTNNEITNYHFSEDDVLYYSNDYQKIDTSNYIIEDGKLYYKNGDGTKGDELTDYHKVKDADEYYNNQGLITNYCWKGNVLYNSNGEHTTSYKVIIGENGTVYDINSWDIENLTENNKIISGSILKFIGENDTPKATVIYSTAVTGLEHSSLSSISQTNTVYTGSDDSSPPTNTNSSATVEYKNELVLVKRAADDGFDEETETFKWKLKLYANASSRSGDQVSVDTNSLETINGYTIEDTMFKNVTAEELNSNFNCIMNDGSETTEYCKYVTITKETATKIKFTINTTVMEQEQKTGVISGIELFYNTSAENTLDNTVVGDDGLTEYQRYQNHTAVTKQNDATAYDDDNGYSSHDGIGITAQTRYSATKTFIGNKEPIIEQDVSQDTKVLDWKIALIKDQGFSKDSVVLVDGLGSSTTQDGTSVDTNEKVLHYLTQSQLDSIVLKGRTTELGSENTIDSNLYEVEPTTTEITDGENSTSFITGFKIKFKEGIDTANYRYIDVTYQTTASLKDVEAGWKTVFTNGCDFGNHSDDTGITYEHEDINKSKPTTLKLNKTWEDGNNIFQTRPDEIKVKVLQATEGSNEWNYIMDLETEEPKIYTLSVNDNMIIGDDFPQWKTVTNDGVTTTIRYQYKIEEVLEEGSPYTASAVSPVTANGDNTNLSLTNTLTERVYNKIPDQESMSKSQIRKITVKEVGVGGVETDVDYYVFKWKVNMNLTQNTSGSTIRTFVDTMPNGFIYVSDEICESYLDNNNNKPLYNDKTKYHYKDGTNAYASQFSESYHTGESVTPNGNTITFKVRENIDSIEYCTIIRVDEFDRALTNGTITNKIRLQEKGETDHPAVVTITDIPPTDNENVKKMYKGGSQGTLRYALDFNPQGKKLSNSKYVDITDTLKYETESADTLDNLKFSLTNLKVYEYQADGSYTELSKSDYRSSVSYSNVTDVQSLTLTKNANDDRSTVEGWNPGDTLTLSVSNGNIYYFKAQLLEYDSNNNITYHDLSGATSGSLEVTIKSDTQKLEVSPVQGLEGATVSVKTSVDLPEGTLKNTPAILHIEVPDQKYLRIEYTYTVTGYTEAPEGSNNKTNVIVSNTASFATDNAAGYDNSDHNAMNVDHSSATSNTKTHPEIYKVDANSLSIDDLAAKFVVLKYDVENHTWIYAESIAAKSGDGVPTREITFGTDVLGSTIDTSKPTLEFTASPTDGSTAPITANHKFTLEPNAIYRFIEIAAPEGYRQPPASGNVADYDEFTFYYAYALSGQIPAALSSIDERIYTVVQDGRFDIPNSKYVSISAKKEFSGKTSEVPDSATVKLQLYWSYYRDGTELNTFGSEFPIQSEYSATFNATKDLSYTKNGTNTVTWQGLPDAYYGKPVYYYVKEQSYTYEKEENTYSANANNDFSDGVFKPIYVNNGTNANGDTITVNNASGLVIRKEWLNSSGNTINPPNEVDSDIGNTENSISVGFTLTAVVIDSNKTVTLNIPVTLGANNSYEYAIEAGEKVADTDGNKYDLSDLKNFAISEVLTATQQSEIGDDYVFSPAYEMSNNMGVIKLINTSTMPDKTSATVEKVWVGTSREVNVELYQTKTPNLTEAQIAVLSAGTGVTKLGEQTLNSGNNFTYTWNNLDNVDSNGSRYYYYVKETSSFDGVSTFYEVEVSGSEQKTTITNTEDTNLVVTKAWGSTPESYRKDVVVQLWVSDDGYNNWTNTGRTLTLTSPNWSDRFGNLDKAKHYKVVETTIDGSANALSAFTIAYSSENVTFNEGESSKEITVTNTIKSGKIKIKKIWNLNGQTPTLPDSIIVTLTDSKNKQYEETLTLSSATQNGSEYEWTIQELPLYALDGTQLTYTATETAIDGFAVSYGNNNGIAPDQWNNPGTITITNTWTEFSLAIKKDWSDSDTNNHTGDTVTVVLHRSTDPSKAPEQDLIDDSGGGDAPTGNDFTYYYNTAISADKVIKLKLKNNGSESLSFSGAWCAGPQEEQFSDPGNGWGRSVDNDVVNNWWIQYPWSVSNLTENAETEILIPVKVGLQNNSQLQLWWVSSGTTDTAPITAEYSIVSLALTFSDGQTSKEIDANGTVTLQPKWSDDTNVSDVTYEFSTDGTNWSTTSDYVSVSGNTLTGNTATSNPVYVRAKKQVGGVDKYSASVQVMVNDSGGGSASEYAPLNGIINESKTLNFAQNISSVSLSFEGEISGWPESVVKFSDEIYAKFGIYPLKTSGFTDGVDGLYLENSNSSINESYLSTHSTGDFWNKTYYYSFNSQPNGRDVTITFPNSVNVNSMEISEWKNMKITYSIEPKVTVLQAPRPPMQLQSLATTSATSPLNVQHVYRVGKLTRAKEIIEENEDIETISQAVTLLSAPKFTILSASSDNWISESGGEALTIQIRATDNNWQKLIENLPMYDASGNKYYYWATEQSMAGYTASYKFDDGDSNTTYCINAENHGNGVITVLNTKNESDSTTLPEAGGSGASIYYITGALLMLLTAAGYTMFKRRRWLSE